MKIRIIHHTEYEYTDNIFLEPHYLRLKPKSVSYLSLESFKIDISPDPTGISEFIDAENNGLHFCWFEDLHRKLIIRTDMVITISDFNPFHFIIYPDEYNNLPYRYDEKLENLLKPALEGSQLPGDVFRFLDQVKKESYSGPVDFILMLTRKIWTEFKLRSRTSGPPHDPGRTFTLKKGSCRDLAWMQVQLLRNIGIACRFVSGYYFLPMEKPDYELHAWLEVFLPGAGWIGFDPSHGIMAGNSHIPLASSAYFENTMPVSGSVRGDAVSKLITNLEIEVLN
jgi:transglutaminase-like putative cysteine protease